MKLMPILVALCVVLWGNAFGRGVEIPVNISHEVIEGRPVLVIESDVAWPDTVAVGYSSIAMPIEITGTPDERLAAYLVGCYNAPGGDGLAVEELSAGGYNWVREASTIIFDVTRFFDVREGRARMRCVIGDFASNGVVSSLTVGSDKEMPRVTVRAVPSGRIPGAYRSADRSGRNAGQDRRIRDPFMGVRLDAAPNPFNASVAIKLAASGGRDFRGSLSFYNIRGERVFRDDVSFNASMDYIWRGKNDLGHAIASGVYFVVLRTERGEVAARGSMALVK